MRDLEHHLPHHEHRPGLEDLAAPEGRLPDNDYHGQDSEEEVMTNGNVNELINSWIVQTPTSTGATGSNAAATPPKPPLGDTPVSASPAISPSGKSQDLDLERLGELVALRVFQPVSLEYLRTSVVVPMRDGTEIDDHGGEDIVLMVPADMTFDKVPALVQTRLSHDHGDRHSAKPPPTSSRGLKNQLEKSGVHPVTFKNSSTPKRVSRRAFFLKGFTSHFQSLVQNIGKTVPLSANDEMVITSLDISYLAAHKQYLSDIFIEGFTAAYRKLPQFRDPEKLRTFLQQAAQELIEDLHSGQQRSIYVSYRNGILGFLCYKEDHADKSWYLSQLAVAPYLMRNGIGEALMKHFHHLLPPGYILYGLVRKVNLQARAFYTIVAQRLGLALQPSNRWCSGYSKEEYDSYECSKEP